MVVNKSSARPDFSSMVPMKMKKGTASRMKLDITPKIRDGMACNSDQLSMPASTPMPAKMRAVPPSEKDTG